MSAVAGNKIQRQIGIRYPSGSGCSQETGMEFEEAGWVNWLCPDENF